MGTSESQFGEWVELYNDSGQEVDLSGWKLFEGGGGTLIFTFTKKISPKGYVVLERTTGSSPDPLPSINDEAGPFGGGGLSNSGEFLVLKDATGSVVHSLDFSSGWPAGDTESKQTMQWNGTTWVTAPPTPKGGLLITGGESTPQPSGGTSYYVPVKKEPRITFDIPSTLYTNIEYSFSADVSLEYGPAYSGGFVWNMGDGTIYKSTTPKTITHTFHYPGTYVVSFGFFKNSYDKEPFLFNSIRKKVADVPIVLQVKKGLGILLSNTTKEDVDVSGWIIRVSDKDIVLPPLSYIAGGEDTLLSFKTLGISSDYEKATLLSPQQGELISIPTQKRPYGNPIVSDAQPSQLEEVGNSKDDKGTFLFTQEALLASAEGVDVTDSGDAKNQKSHTKAIFFGVALLISIGLFLLLERFMAQEE